MPFQKNNKFGAKKRLARPLDKQSIAFKGYEGQYEKLKAVPNWHERLSELVHQLMSDLPKNE